MINREIQSSCNTNEIFSFLSCMRDHQLSRFILIVVYESGLKYDGKIKIEATYLSILNEPFRDYSNLNVLM